MTKVEAKDDPVLAAVELLRAMDRTAPAFSLNARHPRSCRHNGASGSYRAFEDYLSPAEAGRDIGIVRRV